MKTLSFAILLMSLNAFADYDIWPVDVVKRLDDKSPVIQAETCNISFSGAFMEEVSGQEKIDEIKYSLAEKGWEFGVNVDSTVEFKLDFVPHFPNDLSPEGYPAATLEVLPTGVVERLKFHKKIVLMYSVDGQEQKFSDAYATKFYDFFEETKKELFDRIISEMAESIPSCKITNIQ